MATVNNSYNVSPSPADLIRKKKPLNKTKTSELASSTLSQPTGSSSIRKRAFTNQSSQGKKPAATIALSTRKSTGPTMHKETHALGTMTHQDHPHAIHFSFKVRYDGANYVCKFILPTLKPTSELTAAERDAFNRAAEMHKDLCLKDLEKRAKGKIRGGQDFKVLFTETGYTAYVPSDNDELNFDPERQSLEEAKKGGYFKTYVSSEETEDSQIGLELAKAIGLGEALQMCEYLKNSKILAPLRSQENREILAPVGLTRDQQQCYFNSAFSLWATNPFIRDELLKHPNYLKGETSNPLYIALSEYQKHRKNKKTYKLNDSFIKQLGFDPSKQNDVDHVLKAFANQLDYKQIPQNSPLHSQTKTVSFCKDKTDSAETQVERVEESCLASRTISIQKGKKLQEMLKEQCQRNTNVDGVLKSANNKSLVARSEQFKSAPDVFFVCVKRNNSDPIDVDFSMTLPKEVCGEEAEYELMGFSVHKGNLSGGHYVTDVREGEDFHEIDDAKVQSLSREKFLENAKGAYVYVFNKKGLASTSSSVKKTEQNQELEQTKIEQTTLRVERGKLSSVSPEFILVNPTDSTITQFHPEIDPASIKERTTAAKQHAAKGKNTFTLSDVLEVPKVQEKHAVLHVNFHSNKKGVKKALKTVLKQTQVKQERSVAFPLFAYPNINEAEVLTWMKEAAREFITENKSQIQGIQEIKIILTPEQAKKALPTMKSSSHQIGSTTLIIKEAPVTKVTKTKKSEEDLQTDFQKGSSIVLSNYDLDINRALTIFSNAFADYAETNKEKKTVELVVPSGTSVDELIWDVNRIQACLEAKLKPARGKIVLVQKTPDVEMVIETGDELTSSLKSPRYTLDERYSFFEDDESELHKSYPEAEYVFDLRSNANEPSVNREFISLPVDTKDPNQTLMNFLSKLEKKPLPSKRKIRIILPMTEQLPNQLKQVQETMKKVKVDHNVKKTIIPTETKPKSTGLRRFWDALSFKNFIPRF